MTIRAPSTGIRIALICAALTVSGTALAADPSKPMACGANGCAQLPTSTLQGLLTLPEALQPTEPPGAQPYILFRVVDLDGAVHEVVYVSSDDEVLLGFDGEMGWRLVPADDARLLADAVAGRTPYPAPAADAPLDGLFEPNGADRSNLEWLAIAGIAALAVAAYAGVRRWRR